MGIGEGDPRSPSHPVFYSEREAARLSDMSQEAMMVCVAEGLVIPAERGGESCFTDQDIMKLKLVKAMVSVQLLEDGVSRIYRSIGQERLDAGRSSARNEAEDIYSRIVRLILKR